MLLDPVFDYWRVSSIAFQDWESVEEQNIYARNNDVRAIVLQHKKESMLPP
jgi:hypothetical protein